MAKYLMRDSRIYGMNELVKEEGPSRKTKVTSSVEHLGSKTRIGDIDDWGHTLLARNGTVELYRIQEGFFAVYLWINEEDYFSAFRTNRKDADNLFDMTCTMLK